MKSTTPPPKSVRLTAEELDQVKKIADELGVTEHAVRHYAIQRLIADWGRGWRPKRKRKVVQTLEP